MKSFAAFLSIVVIASGVLAEDWPKWRGPQGDAIVREPGLAEKWPAELKPLWTAQVGIGYSTPVTRDGKLYLLTMIDNKDTLIAFDADSGHELWRQPSGEGWSGRGGNVWPGSRGSPTIDGDRIYVYTGRGDLTAHNLGDGKVAWTINVLKELKSGPNQWGAASTPLVVGDSIYVQGGKANSIAACVNKADGKIKWISEAANSASYAGAILIDVERTKQLIVYGGKDVVAMDPTSGKTIWKEPWAGKFDINAATPIYRDGHLFVTSGYGHGSLMLKISPTSAQRLWESTRIMGRFVTPILDGDVMYGTDESGTVRCLSWPDGKDRWEVTERNLRLGLGGAYIRAGDKLIALSESGTLYRFKATPEGYEKLNEMKIFPGSKDVWTSPLIYNGRLYLKGGTQFNCYDISDKALAEK